MLLSKLTVTRGTLLLLTQPLGCPHHIRSDPLPGLDDVGGCFSYGHQVPPVLQQSLRSGVSCTGQNVSWVIMEMVLLMTSTKMALV